MRGVKTIAGAALLLLAFPATASEELKSAPVPGVFALGDLPAATDATAGTAASLRLIEIRSELFEGGTRITMRQLTSVNDAAALQAAGNIVLTWDPETSDVTLHKVGVHRGDEFVDLLAAGETFDILRREEGLEDGFRQPLLTAVLNIPDLRVGDVIEQVVSYETAQPALAGDVQAQMMMVPGMLADHYRVSVRWPRTLPVTYAAGAEWGDLVPARDGDAMELTYQADSLVVPVVPADVPNSILPAFQLTLSTYDGWEELSRDFATLYTTAAELGPDSEVRNLARQIAAEYETPKARAEAALRHVQQDVRYLFYGYDLGGYIPRPADEVWQRRMGDCKGKTVLLLALLRELGIPAAPALVNVSTSGAIDPEIAIPGWFDHVLVRTEIDGTTYWLDGTRMGDRSLDRIVVPPFKYALPLTAEGATLETLTPGMPADPDTELDVTIDLRDGFYLPGRVEGDIIYRGDQALGVEQALLQGGKQREFQMLSALVSQQVDSERIERADIDIDKSAGTARIHFAGTRKPAMEELDDSYTIPFSRLGRDIAPDRKVQGRYADLPVELHPEFARTQVTVRFPEGAAQTLKGDLDLHEEIGGVRYSRVASQTDDGFSFTTQTIIPSKILALEAAKAADVESDELWDKSLWVTLGDSYTPSEAEMTVLRDRYGDDAVSRLAAKQDLPSLLREERYGDALALISKLIVADPDDTSLLLARASVLQESGDDDGALRDLQRILAREPDNVAALQANIALLLAKGRSVDIEDSVTRLRANAGSDPDNWSFLASAGIATKNFPQALSDVDKALAAGEEAESRFRRAYILSELGRHEEAVADARAALNLESDLPRGRLLLMQELAKLDQMEEARTFYRGLLEDGEMANPARAIALQSGLFESPGAAVDTLLALIESGDPIEPREDLFAQALMSPRTATEIAPLLRAKIADHQQYFYLLQAYNKAAGQPDANLQLFSELAAKNPGSNEYQNNLCWELATRGIRLDEAATACEKALAIARTPEVLDSYGLVALQQGDDQLAFDRYDEALRMAEFASALYGRAIAELRLGLKTDALIDLRRAVKLSPNVIEHYAEFDLDGPMPSVEMLD